MTTRELWFAECPYDDQGLIRPLVATDGTIVLMCDAGGTVWLHPQDVAQGRSFEPEGPDWEAADGVRVVPGTTRWAGRDDLNASPWDSIPWKEL
ncbi:MAG: hypothetical protein ACJ786_30465 [Catenulispora sp.]